LYRPNLVIMHPVTYTSLMSMKDSTGRNMSREYIQIIDGVPYLDGVLPIMVFDGIAIGKFVMGDFWNAVELFDAQKGDVELSEDTELRLTNRMVALIQEEVIFAIKVPQAFLYGNFNNTIDIINKASRHSLNVNITGPVDENGNVKMIVAD